MPANAVPVAPPAPSAKPKGSFSLQLGWSAKSGPTARVSVKPAPTAPVVAPPAVAPGVRLERCEQPTVAAPPIAVPPPAPASLLPATPAPVVPPPAVYLYTQVTPIPMPIHHPFASQSPVTPQVLRLVGRDGLERIGVDIDCPVVPASGSVPVTGRVSGGGGAAVGGVIGHLGEAPSTLMTAYHAACAAGKKDEAARLALQLLANDPTCFSRNK